MSTGHQKKKNPRLKEAQKEKKTRPTIGVGATIPTQTVKNEPIAEWRIGEFHVSAGLIDQMPFEHWQLFQKHFVIIGCYKHPKVPIFIYRAFSPLFDPHGTMPKKVPLYKPNFELIAPKNPDSNFTVNLTVKRVEERKIILPGTGVWKP